MFTEEGEEEVLDVAYLRSFIEGNEAVVTDEDVQALTDEDITRIRTMPVAWKRLRQVGHRWTYYHDNLDGTVTIMMLRGETTLIDKKSLPIVADYGWRVNPNGYVVAHTAYGLQVLMHRLLCPSATYVDHINRNKVDNRLANLRSATPTINNNNRPIQKNNKTGVNGVFDNIRFRHYIVTWRMAGRKHRRCVSYGPRSKHTKEEAFAIACALRRKIDEATGCMNGYQPLQT